MQYISKLFSTGAVRDTPKQVIQSIVAVIGSRSYTTVVEAGAGKGEISNAVLHSSVSVRQYHAFEIDTDACHYLTERFPAIEVHNSSIFDFVREISEDHLISLFVSSIPLSFYSGRKVSAFLNNIKEKLEPGGLIVIIFSAVWLIPTLKRALPNAKISAFLTFPPYFMAVYKS